MPSRSPSEGGSLLAQLRARAALRSAGLDPTAPLQPAPSATNAVWLTPDHVVRVSSGLTSRLTREAALAAALPEQVRYPAVVAAGTGLGDDWIILERAPGSPLAHLWPDLPIPARRRALGRVAESLRALHQVDAPAWLQPLDGGPQLLQPAAAESTARLVEALERAAELRRLPALLARHASAAVREAAAALGEPPAPRLIHGDLTFENVLWHDGELTALIDLEWAAPAPPDLDLDVMLRMCAYPQLHVAAAHVARARAEDYRDVPRWLAERYPQLFDTPRLTERLRVYAIAFEVRELLDSPPPGGGGSLPSTLALHRLRQVLAGASYLDDLARELGW